MIKKLTKITDIQVGDYLPISGSDSSTPLLAEVTDINPQNNFCSYKSLDKTYFNKIWEKDLKQTILLRNASEGLDILMGDEAYKKIIESAIVSVISNPKT